MGTLQDNARVDTHGVESEINLIWKGVFVIVVGSCK